MATAELLTCEPSVDVGPKRLRCKKGPPTFGKGTIVKDKNAEDWEMVWTNEQELGVTWPYLIFETSTHVVAPHRTADLECCIVAGKVTCKAQPKHW